MSAPNRSEDVGVLSAVKDSAANVATSITSGKEIVQRASHDITGYPRKAEEKTYEAAKQTVADGGDVRDVKAAVRDFRSSSTRPQTARVESGGVRADDDRGTRASAEAELASQRTGDRPDNFMAGRSRLAADSDDASTDRGDANDRAEDADASDRRDEGESLIEKAERFWSGKAPRSESAHGGSSHPGRNDTGRDTAPSSMGGGGRGDAFSGAGGGYASSKFDSKPNLATGTAVGSRPPTDTSDPKKAGLVDEKRLGVTTHVSRTVKPPAAASAPESSLGAASENAARVRDHGLASGQSTRSGVVGSMGGESSARYETTSSNDPYAASTHVWTGNGDVDERPAPEGNRWTSAAGGRPSMAGPPGVSTDRAAHAGAHAAREGHSSPDRSDATSSRPGFFRRLMGDWGHSEPKAPDNDRGEDRDADADRAKDRDRAEDRGHVSEEVVKGDAIAGRAWGEKKWLADRGEPTASSRSGAPLRRPLPDRYFDGAGTPVTCLSKTEATRRNAERAERDIDTSLYWGSAKRNARAAVDDAREAAAELSEGHTGESRSMLRRMFGDAKDAAVDAKDAAESAADEKWDATKAKARGVAVSAKEKAHEVRDRVDDRLDTVRGRSSSPARSEHVGSGGERHRTGLPGLTTPFVSAESLREIDSSVDGSTAPSTDERNYRPIGIFERLRGLVAGDLPHPVSRRPENPVKTIEEGEKLPHRAWNCNPHVERYPAEEYQARMQRYEDMQTEHVTTNRPSTDETPISDRSNEVHDAAHRHVIEEKADRNPSGKGVRAFFRNQFQNFTASNPI
eukprot:TRINITY_DN15891_c0_g1_i1.p1 TRINITY_DN15891_c0_g1~~TRINITY_DN15891_c0_g1_i1.p1  ORF type:complete len:850 (+),score=192.61 TRINITY_DN15891_c0_g1_i1:161-2551(+)